MLHVKSDSGSLAKSLSTSNILAIQPTESRNVNVPFHNPEAADDQVLLQVYNRYLDTYGRPPLIAGHLRDFGNNFSDVKLTWADAKSFLDRMRAKANESTVSKPQIGLMQSENSAMQLNKTVKMATVGDIGMLSDQDSGGIFEDEDLSDIEVVFHSKTTLQMLQLLKERIIFAVEQAEDTATALHMVWEREYAELESRIRRVDKQRKLGMSRRRSSHQYHTQSDVQRDAMFKELKSLALNTDVNEAEHDAAMAMLEMYYPNTEDSLIRHNMSPRSRARARISDSSDGASTKEIKLQMYDTMVKKAREKLANFRFPGLLSPAQTLKVQKSAPTASKKTGGRMQLETIPSAQPYDAQPEEENLSTGARSVYVTPAPSDAGTTISSPSGINTPSMSLAVPRSSMSFGSGIMSRNNSIRNLAPITLDDYNNDDFVNPALEYLTSTPLDDPDFLQMTTTRGASVGGLSLGDDDVLDPGDELYFGQNRNSGNTSVSPTRSSMISVSSTNNNFKDSSTRKMSNEEQFAIDIASIAISRDSEKIMDQPAVKAKVSFSIDDDQKREENVISKVPRDSLNVMTKYAKEMDSWDFDLFAFMDDPALHGKQIVFAGFYLFRKTGLLDATGVSQANLWRFLEEVQNGYLDNPYHNMYHAVDVMLNTHYMFNSSLFKTHMTIWDQFGAYIAAVCHDLGHMGLNNQWYINTAGTLALLWGDESVLENHHVVETFRILNKAECNWMLAFPSSIRHYLAFVIRRCIIGTDMKYHGTKVLHLQELVDTYKKVVRDKFGDVDLKKQVQHQEIADHVTFWRSESVSNYANLDGIRRDQFKLFMDEALEKKGVRDQIIKDMDVDNKEEMRIADIDDERIFLLEITVHTCDVGNPGKRLDISRQWANRYLEEAFKQGDQERDLGIPISPGMDRNTAQLPASQIGFIKFVVKRLYQLLAELIDSAEVVVDNMLANEKHWIAEKERLSVEEKEREEKEREKKKMKRKSQSAQVAPNLKTITESQDSPIAE